MGRKVLVGFLLLGALFIFGLATFYVENLQYSLGKGYRLHARFPVAQTLDRGDVVRLQGVPVGTVDNLSINTELAEEYPVETTLWIRGGYTIRSEDKAVIRMSSLFGGYFVAIERGDFDAPPLQSGDYIKHTHVAPSITQVVEDSAETLESIREAFDDVSALMDDLTAEGGLGDLLRDDELMAKVRATISDTREAAEGIKTATQRLEAGEGVLGRLLMDDALAADLESLTADLKETAANARSISADLTEGKGTLGRMLQDEELYSQLTNSLDTISEAARLFKEGEGLLPQLLKDQQMAEDLRSTVADAREAAASLREVAADLQAGEGSLSKLLTSDEAYRKLDASLDDLNEFTTALAEGEGTLSRLMKDEELYEKLRQIADDLQGILDAYREQSPVISLAGAVFGAF